jgi:hypothetical protein
VQNAPTGERRTVIGINNAPPTVQAAVTRSDRFKELSDLSENRQLHMALMTNFNTWRVYWVCFSFQWCLF